MRVREMTGVNVTEEIPSTRLQLVRVREMTVRWRNSNDVLCGLQLVCMREMTVKDIRRKDKLS